MIRRELARVYLRHRVDLAARVVDHIHATLVAEIPGQMAVLPQHHDGPLTRPFDLASPGEALLCLDRGLRTDKCNLLAISERKVDVRVAVLIARPFLC